MCESNPAIGGSPVHSPRPQSELRLGITRIGELDLASEEKPSIARSRQDVRMVRQARAAKTDGHCLRTWGRPGPACAVRW